MASTTVEPDLAAARRSLEGLARAVEVPFDAEQWRAADLLGNGQRIRADDTVPFALWTAARHPDDLEAALWARPRDSGTSTPPAPSRAGSSAPRSGSTACPPSGSGAASR